MWRHGTHSRLASQTWRAQAACHGTDVDVFYPAVRGGRGVAAVEAQQARDSAIAVCRRCAVADDCLAYALDHQEDHGVWGATTPQDRDALRRLRRRRGEVAS